MKSLVIRSQTGVPEINVNLHWLARQKKMLGVEKFQNIVEKEVGKKQAENVYEMLGEFAKNQESDDGM